MVWRRPPCCLEPGMRKSHQSLRPSRCCRDGKRWMGRPRFPKRPHRDWNARRLCPPTWRRYIGHRAPVRTRRKGRYQECSESRGKPCACGFLSFGDDESGLGLAMQGACGLPVTTSAAPKPRSPPSGPQRRIARAGRGRDAHCPLDPLGAMLAGVTMVAAVSTSWDAALDVSTTKSGLPPKQMGVETRTS